MSEFEIDVRFDMRTDTPPGLDPDSHSPTLKRSHQLLWQKPLPNGALLSLTNGDRQAYLVHDGQVGRLALASDTIVTSNRRKCAAFYDQLPTESNERFHRLGYTVGGFVLFPGAQIDRKQTINQARGMNARIGDRFDLSLECIRRHYASPREESPLSATLARYVSFFELFGSFADYVAFFLLDDLVDFDGSIRFFRPFEGFVQNALPRTLEDYVIYREAQMTFVEARNRRIDEWWSAQRLAPTEGASETSTRANAREGEDGS